jgi:hypothetical protein
MRFQRIAIPAVVAVGLAALPVSAAKAQPYYPYPFPCNPFPLFWPFCAAAAIVGGVGAIVTAPFRGTFYPYYPGYYYGSPAVPYGYPPTGAYYPQGQGYSPAYAQPGYVAPGYSTPGYSPPGYSNQGHSAPGYSSPPPPAPR